jgi:hypothetical protein
VARCTRAAAVKIARRSLLGTSSQWPRYCAWSSRTSASRRHLQAVDARRVKRLAAAMLDGRAGRREERFGLFDAGNRDERFNGFAVVVRWQ